MTTTQAIQQLINRLPADLQQELLDFGEFLMNRRQPTSAHKPYPSLAGACKDLGPDISTDDIDQARQEMWHSFPRKDIA